jgi:hypothetical protein
MITVGLISPTNVVGASHKRVVLCTGEIIPLKYCPPAFVTFKSEKKIFHYKKNVTS